MELSIEQKNIIYNQSQYLQIIAAAGSGKTFTIVEMVSYLINMKSYSENEILMISFTKKAAGEIRERLKRKIGNHSVNIFTFHAYCLRVLKKFHPDYKKSIKIISPEIKKNITINFFKENKFLIGGIPYDLLLSESNEFLKIYFPNLSEEINSIYNKYKKDKKAIDYDDMVNNYLIGLEKNEYWIQEPRNKIKFILVDEFQDTDLTQLKWLQLLNPERLVVVGDDWQAIYGFRGATTDPFLNLDKYFSPLTRLYLSTNYRSDKNIIEVSKVPILKNKKNISKNILPFSNESGKVKVFKISGKNDWDEIIFEINKNISSMVLVRTNYRIKKLIKLGVKENQILTIHSAKGLEFENVFIDLTDGWSSTYNNNENYEEERRVLYVGLSRAKKCLTIIGLKKYSDYSLESTFFSYFT